MGSIVSAGMSESWCLFVMGTVLQDTQRREANSKRRIDRMEPAARSVCRSEEVFFEARAGRLSPRLGSSSN
jgi:hypothetical protein